MAKKLNLEIPDDVAKFVDDAYPNKSPAATIKLLLKEIQSQYENNQDMGNKYGEKGNTK